MAARPTKGSMLFRNTLAQSSRMVVGQLLSLIVAPLLISRLGLTAFGVWAVTGAAANYVGLLDLGVTRSLSRFVALYEARGDRESVRRCMAVGFMAVTVVGVFAFSVALVAAPAVDQALGDPIGEGAMRTVLLSSAALITLQLYSGVCDALPTGLLRMVPPSIAGIYGNLCNFAASVGVLLVSPHLTDYAIANAAAALPALSAAAVSMVYVGGRRVVARPSWPLAREILGFGIQSQLWALATLVNFQTDKLIIAVAVGVRASAAYELGARVALAARDLATLTVSAMIPTATGEIVRRGKQAVTTFYRDWAQRVLALSVGVFALAALCSPYVLEAWIGQTPPDARGVLLGLSIAYLVWMTTGVPSSVAMAAGYPGMVARNAVAVAVLNAILTIALAPLFGLWGVLAGTVAAVMLMAGELVVKFHRTFGVPARAFWDAALGPFALGAALAVPLGLLVVFVLPVPSHRPGALAMLALVGGGFGLAYWIAATRLDYLPGRLRFPGIRPRDRAADGQPAVGRVVGGVGESVGPVGSPSGENP